MSEAKIDEFPCIFPAGREFPGFQKDPFFIDSKNSETSSHLTLPSSRESTNYRVPHEMTLVEGAAMPGQSARHHLAAPSERRRYPSWYFLEQKRRTSASAERSAARKSAAPPLASVSPRTRAPLSASRPCTSTCAPACPSLRATSRPTPSVEPVTSASFSAVPSQVSSRGSTSENTSGCRELEGVILGNKNHRGRCSRAPKKRRGALGVRLSSLKAGPEA